MRTVFLSLIVAVFFSGFAIAQKTVVTGKALGAEGRVISIRTYDDFISYQEKELASSRIDSSGNFQITVPLNETVYAWFAVEYYKGEMYLQPRTTHHFNLAGIKFTEETDRINTNLEPFYINVQVDTGDMLNASIQRLNIIYNRFLIDHLREVHSHRFAFYVDSLKTVMDSLFKNVSIEYFTNYKTYRVATLELLGELVSNEELFEQYILHKPVLLGHVEYMSFFEQLLDPYFRNVSRPVNQDILREVVNKENSYTALFDSLAADPYFHWEELREAVMLVTLNNLYALNGYKRANIITILKQFAQQSQIEKHRHIASNLVQMLTRFDAGNAASAFALCNASGDTVRLKNFRGKFVYLNFFTTWNLPALEEMEMMRKLYTKYGQSVAFVSICCDREYMKMYRFAHENKYPWPLLHLNSDYKLLDAYGVKSYPHFVLLDKKGCFISDPAEFPSRNIEMKFNQIIQNEGRQ